MDEQLARLIDENAIRRLITGYAHGVDNRNSDTFIALFTEDALLHGATFRYQGHEKLASIPPALNRYVKTYHTLLNIRIDLDGDRATGETYSLAHHLTPREDGRHNDFVMHITYRDNYIRTSAGWRIAERQVVTEFTEDSIVDKKN